MSAIRHVAGTGGVELREAVSPDHELVAALTRIVAAEGLDAAERYDVVRPAPSSPTEEPPGVLVELDQPVALLLERDGVVTWHCGSEPISIDLFDDEPDTMRLVAFTLDERAPEHDIESRWVQPDRDPDPDYWTPVDEPKLASREPRVLVLLHDAFGSSFGSFGALGLSKTGKELLQAGGYDAILAFDHPTLTRTPTENAEDLFATVRAWPHKAPTIDILAHGRGGLVARALAERARKTGDWSGRIAKIIAVGAPNDGTPLARPESWPRLLDLVSNLALSLEAPVGEHALRAVGALARVLASPEGTRPNLPGLEAMSPEEAASHVPSAAERAVTSAFAVSAGTLAPAIITWLASELEDGPLAAPNDLIVPTASQGAGAGARFERGRSDASHHFSYFLDDDVVRRIADWLGVAVGLGDVSFDVPNEMHFLAEMPAVVELESTARVTVGISHETLAAALDSVHASAAAEVDRDADIVVQLVGKTNLEPDGEGRQTLAPPKRGEPQKLAFDVRATAPGLGELWVLVHQSARRLATLKLRTEIVDDATDRDRDETARGVAEATPPGDIDGLLVIHVIEKKTGGSLRLLYDVASTTLGLRELFESSPIEGDIPTYVNRVYGEILSRYQNYFDDPESVLMELQGYGGELFDELIPPPMQALLWKHRDDFQGILLQSEQPHIPWELIHLKEPGQPIAPDATHFLGQKGLTRWLPDAAPTPSLKVRYGNSRHVVPEYLGGRGSPNPLPHALDEIPFIEERFGAQPLEPTAKAVRRALREPGSFDLIHFACHGEAQNADIGNAKLLMRGRQERGRYYADTLSATTVEQFASLRAEDGTGPIVVLNACQAGREGETLTGRGGFAHAFLKAGAGAFVGALWDVGDESALTFTRTFYDELCRGEPVWKAATAARDAARALGDHTWIAYAIYAHPHAQLTVEGAPERATKPVVVAPERADDDARRTRGTNFLSGEPAVDRKDMLDELVEKLDASRALLAECDELVAKLRAARD